MKLMANLAKRSRPFLVVASLVIVTIVGIADYLTGYEISFSTFYLAAVALAAWFIGKWFGSIVSVPSVAV